MKTISSYLLLCGLLLLGAASCTNSEFKKTKSGLLYKIYSDGKGPVAKKGEYLKFNFIQKLRDSVLATTYGAMPGYIPVDSPRPIYSPIEVFPLLRKGDSAVIVLEADTLQRKYGGPLPPFIKKKDKIIFSFKVLDIFASQDLVLADRNQELNKEKNRETAEVQSYISSHNIPAQKTADGTFVVVKEEGSGPRVDSGKQVSIRYTGMSFPSMKVFESNMSGPGNEPFTFVVGQHRVIQGWDDGLKLFRKGGKGTLYIPAYLAYFDQAKPGHKPYEDMVFDVEVVDVTDAPPAAANPTIPGMPQGMPPGMKRPLGARPGMAPQKPQQH